MSTKRRPKRAEPGSGRFVRAAISGLAVVVFAIVASSPAVRAAEGSTVAPSDPVLRDVVHLLEAKLGEPQILRWLDQSKARPGLPTAADLVALKRAGASDELVAALLERADAAPSPSPSPVATPAAAAAPTPVLEHAPAAPTPAASIVPPPAPVASAALSAIAPVVVPVDVSIRYIHVPDEGEPWQLVVYIDGRPFVPLDAASSERAALAYTEHLALAPGPHVLRWAQERHRERRTERGLHAARFDEEPLAFTLAPGAPATLEVEFRDRNALFLRFGGPVDASVTQGGSEIASRHANSDPAKWPLLCEDLEVNLGGRKPGFMDRQELRSCVRWADLWQAVAGAPGRDVVRPPVR